MEDDELIKEIPSTTSSELSQEDVLDLLKFATTLGLTYPQLIVSSNRSNAELNGLDGYLANPDGSEVELARFSENLEIESQIYRKIISYLGNMLAFDFTYSAKTKNRYDKVDYTSAAYKKDLEHVETFFSKFDYKKEFINVTRQLLRKEIVFVAPRMEGEKIILQELPSAQCRITGRGFYSFRFAFNFSYFMLNEKALDGYPQFFKDTYNEIKNSRWDGHKTKIVKDYWWVDIPEEVGFVFKFNLDTLRLIPVFSGLFKDLINQETMRNLQKSTDMAAAQKIILGQFGRVKDAQGRIGNNFDTDAKWVATFLTLLKNALGGEIKTGALPLEDIKAIEFTSQKDLYKDWLKTSISTSGINSNLIYADSENRSNATETQLSMDVDSQLMEKSIYPQLESFLELYVNLGTKKYHFTFRFEGNSFYTDEKKRLDAVTGLMNYGFFLPQKVASAMGMNPFEFYRQMEEADALGLADKLKQMLNKSPSSEEPGRPALEDDELTDSGTQTRGDAENVDRGGSI